MSHRRRLSTESLPLGDSTRNVSVASTQRHRTPRINGGGDESPPHVQQDDPQWTREALVIKRDQLQKAIAQDELYKQSQRSRLEQSQSFYNHMKSLLESEKESYNKKKEEIDRLESEQMSFQIQIADLRKKHEISASRQVMAQKVNNEINDTLHRLEMNVKRLKHDLKRYEGIGPDEIAAYRAEKRALKNEQGRMERLLQLIKWYTDKLESCGEGKSKITGNPITPRKLPAIVSEGKGLVHNTDNAFATPKVPLPAIEKGMHARELVVDEMTRMKKGKTTVSLIPVQHKAMTTADHCGVFPLKKSVALPPIGTRVSTHVL